MSYATELAAISRKKITLVKITLDYCSLTFGTGDCSATGTECYNTYTTCKELTDFDKTTKTYTFCDADIEPPFDFVRPYVKSIDYLPAEILEDKTVPQRVNIIMLDERDYDIGIDPYWSDRGYTSVVGVPGTFWKKLIARNDNYRKRIVEIYEGFDSLAEVDYVLKFVGLIDEINYDNYGVSIKCIDLIKGLDEIEYPFKTNSRITTAIGKLWKVVDSSELTNLVSAEIGDYARKTLMDVFLITTADEVYDASGELDGNFTYCVVSTQDGQFYGRTAENYVTCVSPTTNAVELEWEDVSAEKYYVFRAGFVDGVYEVGYFDLDTATSWTDTGTDEITLLSIPGFYDAEVYYELEDYDPTDAGNWTLKSGLPNITTNEVTQLTSSTGYIQIDKEIIYYGGKASTTLTNIKRGQFGTETERHKTYAFISRLVFENPMNPYDLAKKLLTDYANYSTDYIDTDAYDDYALAWTSIQVSLEPITKKTKLSNIYFDLMNILDCKSWQNEAGKITLRENSESASITKSITDDDIIEGSTKVFLNDKGRFTRVSLLWFRVDFTEDITSKEAYKRLTLSIDSDAETKFSEDVLKEMHTVFINENCGTDADLSSYVDALLLTKLTRLTTARVQLECELELKDSDIKLGDFIEISTDEFNNTDGSDYSEETFQVLKKEYTAMNKIRFLLEKVIS